MKHVQKDLFGTDLTYEDTIELIYDGPSFDGRMELNKLSSQLKSTEQLIRELLNQLYLQRFT